MRTMSEHASLSRRLVVAFCAAGAVAAVTLAAHVSFTVFGSRPLEHGLQRSVAGVHALDRSHQAMLDQETGLRGYLDTGDPRFLQPYHAGRGALAEANAEVARDLSSSRGLVTPLIDLRVAQSAWLSKWADAALRRPHFATAQAKAAFLGQGKALFDAYRGAERALSDDLQQHVSNAQANLAVALNRSAYAEAGLIVAIGLVLLLCYLWLRRDVVPQLAELVEGVERMRHGELEPSLPRRGAVEIRTLSAKLDGLAQSLGAARHDVAAEHAAAVAHAQQLALVVESAHDIAGSLDPNHVVHAFAAGAIRVTGAARARVWLTDDEGDALRLVFDTAGSGEPELMLSLEDAISPVARAVRFGRREHLVTSDVNAPGREVVIQAVPMVVAGQVTGALELHGDDEDALSMSSEVAEGLALQAAAALAAAEQYRSAQVRSESDGLTGLLNRYRFDVDLDREVQHARRYRRPLALIMIDLDHFKSWNDEFGHLYGDQLLRDIATLIAGSLRASDSAYRYGGEEIVLILRETEIEGAVEAAERLRQKIERECVTPDGRATTASFGVSVLLDGIGSPEILVEAADRALYDAKHNGRNQVAVRNPEISLRGVNAS